MKPISCLVTGFTPFGVGALANKNPSEMIAASMPALIGCDERDSIRVETLILPTCCSSWQILKRQLKRSQPDMLIMLGVAETRLRVALERFALNVRDYSLPDNKGHQPRGKRIRKNGPAAYKSAVKLRRLQKQLRMNGFECDVSNHAGTFVCNDLFYSALHHQDQTGKPELVQFVHVPGLPANGSAVKQKTEAEQVQSLVQTVSEIIRMSAARRKTNAH